MAQDKIKNADINPSAGISLSKLEISTSAQLAAIISDETGTGAAVFNNAPTLVNPAVTGTLTATGAVTGSNLSGTNTGDQTSITGNAGTATKLATARAINGVSFDGTAPITVTAAAGTLTGSTLAAGITASSLTSVGTLASLTVTAPIAGSVTGSSATVGSIAGQVTVSDSTLGISGAGTTASPYALYSNIFPGGITNNIQYNNAGVFGGVNNLTWNNSTQTLTTQNIVMGGSARKLQADFSNATVLSRAAFQTSTTNSNTTVSAIPNGTATTSGFVALNNAIATNASFINSNATATTVGLESNAYGTGTVLPMVFSVAGEKMRLATDGTFTSSVGAIGYGAGAGGAVTQATSKTTAVTLNKPTGVITMASNSMAANTVVVFTLNNSLIVPTDQLLMTMVTSADVYQCWAAVNGTGAAAIVVRNISGSTLSDAVQVRFSIMKSVSA